VELENRLRTMTDHLIQKQSQIDTLLSEKSLLQLHLDHMQRQQQPNYVNNNSEHIINMPRAPKDDDDEKDDSRSGVRLRTIASLVPTRLSQESFVSRKVIDGAIALDRLSTYSSRVLRHSPLARLLFIAYIFLMHLMVFFIFISWNPEMHSDAYGQSINDVITTRSSPPADQNIQNIQ